MITGDITGYSYTQQSVGGSAPDKLLGEIQLDSVNTGCSTARILSGSGFARNNVVRQKS